MNLALSWHIVAGPGAFLDPAKARNNTEVSNQWLFVPERFRR
jgi:hypothetical protein